MIQTGKRKTGKEKKNLEEIRNKKCQKRASSETRNGEKKTKADLGGKQGAT